MSWLDRGEEHIAAVERNQRLTQNAGPAAEVGPDLRQYAARHWTASRPLGGPHGVIEGVLVGSWPQAGWARTGSRPKARSRYALRSAISRGGRSVGRQAGRPPRTIATPTSDCASRRCANERSGQRWDGRASREAVRLPAEDVHAQAPGFEAVGKRTHTVQRAAAAPCRRIRTIGESRSSHNVRVTHESAIGDHLHLQVALILAGQKPCPPVAGPAPLTKMTAANSCRGATVRPSRESSPGRLPGRREARVRSSRAKRRCSHRSAPREPIDNRG